MGNATSTDQPEQMESASFSNENESSMSHSPLPSQIDLSHLSPDERAQIRSVLTRHLSFERKEQARIEMLRKEMSDFERSVSAASSSASHSISDGLCAICRTAPLLESNGLELITGGSGERCDSCGRVCCLNCGQLKTSKTTQDELWVCLVCEKRYEFIMKSGLWFNLKDACPTVAHFGLHLHDKPAGDLSAKRQSSPEILPSIVVTQPSVKGRKKKMVFHEPDEVGIFAPCSSDSDECGGFTPPEDNLCSSTEDLSIVGENGQSSQEMGKANGSGHTGRAKRPLKRSQNDVVSKSGEEKSRSSSHDKTSQSPRRKKDSPVKELRAAPPNKGLLTSISSGRKHRKSKEMGPDDSASSADGFRIGDKLQPSKTRQHVRTRAKTSGETETVKNNRRSLQSSGKRKLPDVPSTMLPKPWTSPQAAAAARQQKDPSCKSTVDRMQPGEKPFPVHLADLDISIDKGAGLSNERVSQMLKTNESLYAVSGFHLNTNKELSVEKEFKDTSDLDRRERSNSLVSYEDPNYARIGPGFTQPVHPGTPTAKETEPGYASVESAANSQLTKERTQGYVSDVSLGEVTGPGYAKVRNGVSSEHEDEQTLEVENRRFDTFSLGEISEPGYARVKILAVGQDTSGESEMVVVVDNDSDDEVGYSRIGRRRQQDSPLISSDDDDIPDPGYQRIADVRKQLGTVLTRDEVDALYAQVIKNDSKGRVPVSDSSSLYGKAVKVKVQDPSALYSAVKKIEDATLLCSTADKQKRTDDGGTRSGMGKVAVSDPTALYATVEKKKQQKKEVSAMGGSREEKKARRRLPRDPSDNADGEAVSLKEKKTKMEKKLLQMSCGLEGDTEDMTKSTATPNDIPSSQYGLVKKRMAFFTQQSSDSEKVEKKQIGRALQIGFRTSVSSSVDSESSETPVSCRTSVSSPPLINSWRSSLSSADSFSKDKPTSLKSSAKQSVVKSPVSRVRQVKDTVTVSPVLSMGKEQEVDRADSFSKDKPTLLKSPTEQSDVKSPVGRVRRFKDTVTGSPVLSMGKEQELDKGDSFSKDKPTPLKSPTEQSDVKSPVGRFKDTVTGSPILSMGKEQEMQNTWPCKGKPPVSPNSSDEIVNISLHREEHSVDVDSPPFGLKIEARPGGHRLYVVGITTGGPAMQCQKIGVGDEILSVDGKCYGNSTRGTSALADHLDKVDCVRLKLRKKSRQGAMFKERVKEKQRLQTHDKFSLVESLRLSGSDVSLNSMDSTPERQRTSPFGARKDTNHKQTIPKGPMADTDDSMVSQPAHPISKEEPDSVKNYMTREKTPVLCSEDTDEAMNDGENRAHEAQVEVANHGVVGGTGDLSVLRDKGKKKKLTFWQRFSAAVTKKGHVVGSVEDLREVPMSGSFNTFQGRRVGSVDCLLDDSRPSMLDRSVGISTCTVSSDESNDSESSVPSTPSTVDYRSPKQSLLTSPLSQPAAPPQQNDFKLGQGQILQLGQTGSSPENVGDVHLSVIYTDNKMTVEIIEARNLDGQNRQNARIPYVKVYLVSSLTHKRLAKQKTKPAKRAADPAFYERLHFTQTDLQSTYLKVMVWRQEGSTIFAKSHCIGQAVISLDELNLSSKVYSWYKLFAVPDQKTETLLPISTSRTM